MDKALLTTKDASSLIGCSQSTLRNYEAVGLLVPAVKVGNRRYYSSSQVTDFILDCCSGSIDDSEQGNFLSSAEVIKRLAISAKFVRVYYSMLTIAKVVMQIPLGGVE